MLAAAEPAPGEPEPGWDQPAQGPAPLPPPRSHHCQAHRNGPPDSSSNSQRCCGAGVGGSVIKLPPGAGAFVTSYGSGSLLFYQRLEELL